MRKIQALLVPVCLISICLSQSSFAQKSGWNKDLSKMMDGLEQEVGGPAPEQSVPLAPPSELPPTPKPKPGLQVEKPDKAAASKGSIEPAMSSEDGEPSEKELGLIPGAIGDNYLGAVDKKGIARWPKSRMPVKVFVEKTSSVPGFREGFATILEQAFNKWAAASKGEVSLRFLAAREEAQITCTWTDDKTQMMSLREGGNTIVVPDKDGILSVDMKILTLPAPGATDISDNYMERVALHEAGHALGITGHSPDSKDMMYAIVYPEETRSSLTERDANTLAALYSIDADAIANLKLQASYENPGASQTGGEIPDTATSPHLRALRMSNEAARLIKMQKFKEALTKLEAAHKLDPTNKLVNQNLGALYSNYGSMAAMTMQFPVAAGYYKKAVPLLEQGSNKSVLAQVLTNYSRVLRAMNRTAEAKQVETRLSKLSP